MTKLSKTLALALMIPALLVPSMTKAAYTPVYTLKPLELAKPSAALSIPEYSILIPEKELINPADDNQTTVDEAKNNYSVNFSPNVENGIYEFNHSDKKMMAVVVDEKEETLSTITAVKMEIRDSNGTPVAVYTLNPAYGQFAKILDLSTLSLDGTYQVILTINSQVETSTSPITFAETTNALTLIGENVDTSNIDDNTDNSSDAITDNYNITVSPVETNGVYEFNDSDKTFSTITVSEADYSSDLEIYKVKINVKDTSTDTLYISKTQTSRSTNGFFIINLDLSTLDIDSNYAATATITYHNTEENTYSTKTYDVVEYRGEGEDSVVDNSEVDNYKVIINKETTDTNNEEVYYYRNTDSPLQLYITEEDRSSSALNEIVRVKYYVRDTDDSNRLVQITDIPESSASSIGYYVLNMDLSNLNDAHRYEVEAFITYVDIDNDDHYYVRSYDVLKLVPKNDTSSDYDAEDLDNVTYNINKALVNYENTNVYLYGENELTNINAYQNSFGSNAPQIVSFTYLENGNSIKNCEDSTSCNLQYELPLNEETGLSVRVNYEYFDNYADRYHRYSKIYDLGRHIRIDENVDNNNDNNSNDSDTNEPSVSNDNLLSLNDFILVKGSSASVYLVNQYNNRFYFPDWSVLKSWFYQPNIIQINDSQLAQYTLKDNVIYRPGSLIKIATDPKCYAVDLDGSLRWVYNENVARAIYGSNWNKNIYTVPDALFPSYSFGSDINSADDFDMPSLSAAVQMYNK